MLCCLPCITNEMLCLTDFQLIRHFDWAMADPMRGIDVHYHAVHIQSNMNLVATPRY